jgi:hypothetical protein
VQLDHRGPRTHLGAGEERRERDLAEREDASEEREERLESREAALGHRADRERSCLSMPTDETTQPAFGMRSPTSATWPPASLSSSRCQLTRHPCEPEH